MGVWQVSETSPSLDCNLPCYVQASDRSKFEQTFQGLQPSKGLLAGDKAKPFMLSSKLPVDALGKVS